MIRLSLALLPWLSANAVRDVCPIAGSEAQTLFLRNDVFQTNGSSEKTETDYASEELCPLDPAVPESPPWDAESQSFDFSTWRVVYAEQSSWQLVEVYENSDGSDRCLILDNTVQICDSYDDHYHDGFVHFPTAFLNTFERVLIIGGGDGMALREVLRYNSIQHVKQLELDPAVPHTVESFWDYPMHLTSNPKVDWTFGDAALTLMGLLPDDKEMPVPEEEKYDLIIVDISETGMSATVSTVEFFALLDKLLRRNGIMAKNEKKYRAELAALYDHFLEIHYRVPFINEQHFIFGSNGTALLQPSFKLWEFSDIAPSFLSRSNLASLVKRYHSSNDFSGERFQYPKDVGVMPPPTIPLGSHMLVEYFEVDEIALLSNTSAMEKVMRDALDAGKFTTLGVHLHPFEPMGLSGIALLAESHLSIHTWPENRYAMVDVLSCGTTANAQALVDALGSSLSVFHTFSLSIVLASEKKQILQANYVWRQADRGVPNPDDPFWNE